MGTIAEPMEELFNERDRLNIETQKNNDHMTQFEVKKYDTEWFVTWFVLRMSILKWAWCVSF